ncbi:gliding motility-associated C-terminal domain-containing protein [Filimonas lacunae]|uniref:Gliding motility-associated C-terminal domain-containing protein n=2 Tax=Filimonas lacunae TaxID=477680 RepID=A0A173MCL2_9BACT|nr:cell surface protein [Filimonas lacunae]SIT22685.1 gliding motility-associated C-terminal domain-containing protein [Filimonas lacunae]
MPGGLLLARHGKGGALLYEYLGVGSSTGTSKYKITVQHYVNCDRISDEPSSVYLGFFIASTNAYVKTVTISRTSATNITKTSFNSCINPVPTVCFYLVTYVTTVELTDNDGGYILAEQECCRASSLLNISNPSNTGFTNFNTIPGKINNISYSQNSSPTLVFKDTAVICYSSHFTIDFGATDVDGDSLSYAFCSGKATSGSDRQPNPPANPPYTDITYTSGYSGAAPLGSNVTIDSKTGIISGTAPATTGDYAVTVCIYEYRSGVLINSTKKEVLVTVANCSLTAATLDVSYINCDNFDFTFQNQSTASNINQYAWDFGVTTITTDTSSQPTPSYTYPDTGTYTLKLRVSTSSGCTDSTTSTIKVYPGFTPDFTYTGRCYLLPFQFTDATYAKYGSVNSWSWSFGDGNSATTQNPSHTYSSAATRTVTLLVGTSKGCSGTASKTVVADEKPTLTLPFHDTLICSIDTLPLLAYGTGTWSWSPNYNIINPNTSNPLVYPKDTAVYVVTLSQNGCVNADSITVNVLDFITVKLPSDTTVCATDSFTLSPVSYALQYLWSPSTGLSSSTVKYPVASPASDITYHVTANLGKCQDATSINIHLVPYPQVSVTGDTTICFGKTTTLHGTITASSFSWSPTNSMLYPTTLNPIVGPSATTYYILTAYDTLGCPKPSRDTAIVTVIPKIPANAGNDTSVVAGQPLQLLASGGVYYQWSPSTGLSSTSIANPIAILSGSEDSVTYTVRVSSIEGCYADDYVKVKIYRTPPDIFVPTGFTPNADGRNDVLKPILVGIKTFSYFRVYNRWGQLLYQTSAIGSGWDGTASGNQQPSGTYVFVTEGIDYTGKAILRKGTTVLIR